MKRRIAGLFLENLSYKLISLFIALILWITILGRSDSVSTRLVEVEILTGPGVVVTSQSAERVKIKVSGPRTALRRFVENGLSQVLTLDLSDKAEGSYRVEIPRSKVDLPFGVKLVAMNPETLEVRLDRK